MTSVLLGLLIIALALVVDVDVDVGEEAVVRGNINREGQEKRWSIIVTRSDDTEEKRLFRIFN